MGSKAVGGESKLAETCTPASIQPLMVEVRDKLFHWQRRDEAFDKAPGRRFKQFPGETPIREVFDDASRWVRRLVSETCNVQPQGISNSYVPTACKYANEMVVKLCNYLR